MQAARCAGKLGAEVKHSEALQQHAARLPIAILRLLSTLGFIWNPLDKGRIMPGFPSNGWGPTGHQRTLGYIFLWGGAGLGACYGILWVNLVCSRTAHFEGQEQESAAWSRALPRGLFHYVPTQQRPTAAHRSWLELEYVKII